MICTAKTLGSNWAFEVGFPVDGMQKRKARRYSSSEVASNGFTDYASFASGGYHFEGIPDRNEINLELIVGALYPPVENFRFYSEPSVPPDTPMITPRPELVHHGRITLTCGWVPDQRMPLKKFSARVGTANENCFTEWELGGLLPHASRSAHNWGHLQELSKFTRWQYSYNRNSWKTTNSPETCSKHDWCEARSQRNCHQHDPR